MFVCNFFGCVYTYALTDDLLFYCSDPPEVSVDNTATPAVEYTTRNLTCRISGGKPSDPMSYHYEWMYKPTYHISAAYTHPPYGMC